MTRDRGLPLLLGLLMAYGLFVAECRYHQREDATTATTKTEVKHHRHRHRHEPANRRSHHDLAARSWQEVDYEYDGDSEEPIDDYEDDYVLRSRSYYENPRSHQRAAARRSYHHGRMFEPRYPARYHAGSGYHARYDNDGNDRRRTLSSRYKTRNHHYRPSGRTYHTSASYPRSRDFDDVDDDETEEDYDYERLPYGYAKSDGADKRREWWRNSKRRASYRKNWRSKVYDYPRGARRHRLEDREGIIDRGGDVSRWTDNWRRRSNSSSELKYHFSKDDGKTEEDEDYEDHGGLEEGDKDEDEDDVWKDIDDDDEDEEENEEEEEEEGGEEDLGRDFYKSEAKPLLRTYDDIIRRLTSDEPTTQRTAVKRNYRNIETDKHVNKRDGYNRELKYETRNVSRPADLLKYAGSTRQAAATAPNYFLNKRIAESSSVKSVAGGSGGRKSARNAIGVAAVRGNDRQQQRKTAAAAKTDDTHAKTKSLEQDYDEYPNGPDNEKDDELVKAGVEEDSGTMQADVTSTDYADDEDETSINTLATSTTNATTTTTTTTTTPKSLVKQHYDYRDSRVYESGTTGAQYNGYQAKNDYPPMSAHSMHKWRSLGTPEGVRETRNNMQQYNKNGKSAELREALQHARKVNKEGSCQWPRARVIQVRDIYPSPSTTYIPHCAILHRCSDDTGCCRSEALTCMPKHADRVELSFYTTSVGGANVVAKLAFYNHTECECKERKRLDAENERPETSDHRVYRHDQTSSPPQNMKKPPRKPCRCPSEFTPRITSDGVCQCNCYESNQNCIKTKRGKAFLSLTDRMCIQSNECAMPNCEFGVYVKLQGRCPRKKDTFDALSDYHNNLSHRFKS